MTPAREAAGWLLALADSMRGAEAGRRSHRASLPHDRACAIDALCSMPQARAEHPYPSLLTDSGGPVAIPHLAAQIIRREIPMSQQVHDYGEALRAWDREEREREAGQP